MKLLAIWFGLSAVAVSATTAVGLLISGLKGRPDFAIEVARRHAELGAGALFAGTLLAAGFLFALLDRR